MNFRLTEAMTILERTPKVLYHLLGGLQQDWTSPNEEQRNLERLRCRGTFDPWR